MDAENPLPAVTTLPLLQLPGRLIENSLDITHWAVSRRPELGLWPESRVRQQSIENLIATTDGPFANASERYQHASGLSPRNRQQCRNEAEIFLAQLEARVARMGYLVGAEETLADIAILPFIHIFAEVDRDWFDSSPYLALRIWLERYRNRALWLQCLEPIPLWKPGNEPFYLVATDIEAGIPTLRHLA